MLSARMVGGTPPGQVHDLPTLKDNGETRATVQARSWECKFCQQPMTARLGAVRVWHFAHQTGASSCPVHTECEPESQLHLMLKRASADSLRTYFGEEVATLEYEVRIPDAGRIADALITLQDGSRIAIEAQLSPISQEHLQERTMAYLAEEIEVIWVFLEERLNAPGPWQEHRRWLLAQGCLVLSAAATVQEKNLRLK
jgi:competence CoiA-like predicted nuclease